MSKNIKIILFLTSLVLLILGFFFVNLNSKQNKVELELEKAKEELKEDNIFQENINKKQVENEKEPVNTLPVSEEKIPNKILIPVPFTSQAPFKKWDALHEEACEEASIIMLRYFFSKEKLTPEIAEREIQALVKFQNKKLGDYKDTTAAQTADLFLDFYGELPNGKKLKVVYDFDKTALKKYLACGNPIIIPAAGRELGNPNFTAPGPLYHNLVLVGYDGDMIITNDPGTRKGEGYKYNIDILYNSIHDFTGKPEDIKKGRKAMIFVE